MPHASDFTSCSRILYRRNRGGGWGGGGGGGGGKWRIIRRHLVFVQQGANSREPPIDTRRHVSRVLRGFSSALSIEAALSLPPSSPRSFPRRTSSFSERGIAVRRRVGKKIIDRSLIAAPSVDITTRNIAEKLIANQSRRRRNHLPASRDYA
jgi:hypothetical protein